MATKYRICYEWESDRLGGAQRWSILAEDVNSYLLAFHAAEFITQLQALPQHLPVLVRQSDKYCDDAIIVSMWAAQGPLYWVDRENCGPSARERAVEVVGIM